MNPVTHPYYTPTPEAPKTWLGRQPEWFKLVATALAAMLLQLLSQWGLVDLRPAAPELVPAQQQKLDEAVKTAAEVREVFGFE